MEPVQKNRQESNCEESAARMLRVGSMTIGTSLDKLARDSDSEEAYIDVADSHEALPETLAYVAFHSRNSSVVCAALRNPNRDLSMSRALLYRLGVLERRCMSHREAAALGLQGHGCRPVVGIENERLVVELLTFGVLDSELVDRIVRCYPYNGRIMQLCMNRKEISAETFHELQGVDMEWYDRLQEDSQRGTDTGDIGRQEKKEEAEQFADFDAEKLLRIDSIRHDVETHMNKIYYLAIPIRE